MVIAEGIRWCVVVLLAQALALAPPLTPEQQRDLGTADAARDHREQAFLALTQHVRSWNAPAADDGEPIHLTFDAATLLARPEDARGDLFRIEGELLQITPLAPPYEDVAEWFVRQRRSGQPVMVYVVQPGVPSAFSVRNHVRIDGRFYKPIRFEARDRQVRDYPAFVGRFPEKTSDRAVIATTHSTAVIAPLWIIGAVVLGLIVGFIVLRAIVARSIPPKPAGASRLRYSSGPDDVDEAGDARDLPSDPAEALAELRRRAREPALPRDVSG